MVHDLRTLNTLHTEKFLQQCKITGQMGGGMMHRPQMSDDHHPHLRHLNINQHHPMWELDRESAGNGSPQSSDTHSSSSIEDSGSRRSPIGSVSSTESIGPSDIQKLTAQDLRVNGSVLMNALTAPASSNAAATLITAAGGITISRKRVYGSEELNAAVVATQQQQQQAAAVVGALFKARKLDSPIDSGIDSPRGAQGSSHSTNTSVCSSPRSSVEDDNKMAAVKESDDERKESPERYEERHPLLKRALQQPPQIYNGNGAGSANGNGSTGMVSNFQDEVYKPHKKFRRNTSGSNTDDCPSSTQTGPSSPPPPPTRSERPTTNLLASQLAEPPQYLVQQQHRYGNSSSGGSSLLASTLNRVTTTISTEECRRNEILANLILEGNPAERFSGLPRCMMTSTTTSAAASTATMSNSDSYLRQQLQQGSCNNSKTVSGLLMCAAGASPSASSSSSSTWWKSSPATVTSNPSATLTRHIPVPQPPTQPRGLHLPLASPSKEKLVASAAANGNLVLDSQPLNLSTRTPPPSQQQQQQHHDIPTEA